MVLLAVGVLAALAAMSFSESDLSLADFDTQDDARRFVSEHLPVQLGDGVRVEALTYERFTDWHLDALLRFESSAGAGRYMQRVRGVRKLNVDYCYHDATMEGAYFLAKWHACGQLEQESSGARLRVRCHTR